MHQQPKRPTGLLTAIIITLYTLLATATPTPAAEPSPTTFTIQGLDLHDGTIKHYADTYYAYGTMYGCGYQWYIPNTPWCGFGVSTAPTLNGPWTTPTPLFSPSSQDPWTSRTWQETCGGTGQGCFNPRMIQRTGWGANDGVYVLWFNAPRHYSDTGANAYNIMGCNSPAGPCGPTAGAPYGSYHKPSLSVCAGNGDFGMIERSGQTPAVVCTMPGATQLNLEQLDKWGANGTAKGVKKVANMDGPIEGPGGWWDDTTQQYVLTYSDQGCGYCSGTPIGYATTPDLYAGWTAPGNVGWGAPAWARRDFDPSSCGGQPRTVTVIDGQAWQIIDLWHGTRNEATAATHLVPLHYTPTTGTPGDGTVWRPPLALAC